MKLAEGIASILWDFELRQLEIDEVCKLEVVEDEDHKFQPEEDCAAVTTPITSEGTIAFSGGQTGKATDLLPPITNPPPLEATDLPPVTESEPPDAPPVLSTEMTLRPWSPYTWPSGGSVPRGSWPWLIENVNTRR